MKKVNNINELSVGMPLKIKTKLFDNATYYLGRYYGKGKYINLDGTDYDYPLLIAISPSGEIIRGDMSYFMIMDKEEELEELEALEKGQDLPYFPYLLLNGEEYETTNEMESYPLEYSFYPDNWWNIHGYLDIDAKLFGQVLAFLFSKFLGKKYYFNKVYAKNESKCISTYISNIDTREVMLISPNVYQEKAFHNIYPYPFFPEDEFTSQFDVRPLSIPEDDYLLSFRKYFKDTISLGEVVGGEFIPRTFKTFSTEVIVNNPDIALVKDYIIAIMNYKLKYRKPTLDMSDMENILESFGISRGELQKALVYDLHAIEEMLRVSLMDSFTVEESLSRKQKAPF